MSTKRVNQALYDRVKNSLTNEQLRHYEKIGEEMYNTVDFNTGTVLNQCDDIESVACLIEAIKSGLHPKYMSEDEKTLLKTHYGDNWLNVLKERFNLNL